MTDPTDDEKKRRDLARAEAFAQSFKTKLELDPQFRAQMTEMVARVASAMLQIREQFQAVATNVANGFLAFQRNIGLVAEHVAPVLKNLLEGFRQLPEAMRRAALALAQEGWFISPDMPLTEPIEAATLVLDGKAVEAESLLANYFESRLDEIEATLVAALPQRAKLISSAFAAHREGKFELAIPVLLAQTDGVCIDIADRALFMSERGRKKGDSRRPGTAPFVEGFQNDALWSALLSPLGQALPINFTEAERGDDFTGLNRHTVLHGEALDYGTKVNSLKSISLLSYSVWVLTHSKEALVKALEKGLTPTDQQ